MTRAREPAAAGLLHPVALVAVAMLIVNDHALKRVYPGWLTGKLSDFAGLTFFPLLLQAAWETLMTVLKRPWRPSSRVIAIAGLATAVVFSFAKTSAAGADLYRLGLGALQWPIAAARDVVLGRGLPPPRVVAFTQDATDLVALPMLVLPLWLGVRRARRATLPD